MVFLYQHQGKEYVTFKRKEIIYGVNSTFSSEDIPLTSRSLSNSKYGLLSQSVNSTSEHANQFKRMDSSDSGGVSIYQEGPEISVPVLPPVSPLIDAVERRLEMDSWSELSESNGDNDSLRLRSKSNIGTMQQIAVDLLDQERTALRDLRIVSQQLHQRICPYLEKCRVLAEMFTTLQNLCAAQGGFVEELESICKSTEKLSELSSRMLCSVHNSIPQLIALLQQYPIYLSALDELAKHILSFHTELALFESMDACYLPVNWLLLKIANRLVFWQPILARIVELQLEEARDEKETTSARVALEKISQFADKTKTQRQTLAEFVAILHTEKDIGRVGLLSNPNRRLLRIGWVERWSQSGPNPRILLLTSDRLLFAHRTRGEHPFAVYGEVKLKGLMVDDVDTYKVSGRTEDAFTLHIGGQSIVLASPSKNEWIEDISTAIKAATKCRVELPPIQLDVKDENQLESLTKTKSDTDGSRFRSLLHICWHRKVSLGTNDIHKMTSCAHSGYLIRKLRNSNGWQRLWVVLCAHTLFFYKTQEDPAPLANLPLIDYGFGLPSLEDNISHDKCFKLYYGQYKYFFRADSQYSFRRWIKAIRSCAISTKNLDMITALSMRL